MLSVRVLSYDDVRNVRCRAESGNGEAGRRVDLLDIIMNADLSASMLSKESAVTLDITHTTGVTELIRNACVNCGIFPIVTTAGRILNVIGLLGMPGDSKRQYKYIHLNCNPTASVVELLATKASILQSTGLSLIIVHAKSAEASIQLFENFIREVDCSSASAIVRRETFISLTSMIFQCFEESGLESAST